MNKIMLQKVINFPALKNNPKKMDKDFKMEIFEKINTNNAKDIYNKFMTMIEELSDDIQIASKFFITKDLTEFVIDNNKLLLNSEKIQQEFRLPFNKPLLLQNEHFDNFTVLIRPVYHKVSDVDYCAEFFSKDEDANKISLNGIALGFNKNIFKNIKPAYENIYTLYLTDAFIPDSEWENQRAQLLTVTLLSFLCATNLQTELQIFETKSVKGLKSINTNHKEYSYRNFLQKPVYEHKVLNINIGNSKNNNNKNKSSDYKKRLHDVRGHLRKLKTGKICWVKEHKRGDVSLGIITKDYNLSYRRSK